MTEKIRNIFTEVPHTYELVNHVLTLGMDIVWRRRAARMAVEDGGTHWIDVCSGTGEMAVYLQKLAKDSQVYSADFTPAMLQKAAEKPKGRHIHFIISDVKALPIPDNSFDLITISFATRNINLNREALLKAFREFHRILKPGGRFVNLETSQPKSPLIRRIFHAYVKGLVLPVGSRISGSKPGYAYLAQTIPRFYEADELSAILSEAGFKNVLIKKMVFGIAAIHRSIKE